MAYKPTITATIGSAHVTAVEVAHGATVRSPIVSTISSAVEQPDGSANCPTFVRAFSMPKRAAILSTISAAHDAAIVSAHESTYWFSQYSTITAAVGSAHITTIGITYGPTVNAAVCATIASAVEQPNRSTDLSTFAAAVCNAVVSSFSDAILSTLPTTYNATIYTTFLSTVDVPIDLPIRAADSPSIASVHVSANL